MQKISEEDKKIKVVIRTRPTPDFASKNIQLDTNNQVSIFPPLI